jgi:hypothetical protein
VSEKVKPDLPRKDKPNLSRRNFLKLLGLGAGAVLLEACRPVTRTLIPPTEKPTQKPTKEPTSPATEPVEPTKEATPTEVEALKAPEIEGLVLGEVFAGIGEKEYQTYVNPETGMVERVWDSETGEVLRAGMSVAEIEGTEPGEKVEVKALVITDKWTEENEGYLAITPEKQEQLARMWWAVAAVNDRETWDIYPYSHGISHLSDDQKEEVVRLLTQQLVHNYLEAQKEGKIERANVHGRLGDPTKLVIVLEHDEKIKSQDIARGAAMRAVKIFEGEIII